MISTTHPYWHVKSILERKSDIVAVPMSYYTYLPQSVSDQRTNFLIPIQEFLLPERMNWYIDQTPPGQEMAINSDIRLIGKNYSHLVMIDMSTSARAHLEKLRAFLGDHFFDKITWFESGRSFHGYGDSLLRQENWVKLMGLLLLANRPKLEATVDPRWIGHRLLAGYSSLRWTKNTPHYKSLPNKIDALFRAASSSSEIGASEKFLNSRF